MEMIVFGVHSKLRLLFLTLIAIFCVIQVRPAVECFTATGAQFEDGRCEDFDAVILATGYRSNVPKWLKVKTLISTC